MRCSTPLLALFVSLVLQLGSAAGADTRSRPCTIGDAQANFEAPLEHLFQSLGVCQYRLFRDGETFTFCEGDFILGGSNNLAEYKALGLTREEAIAILQLQSQRVWLDGEEQLLMHTAFKDGIHPTLGHVVYQHHAFIAQLSPGLHFSYFESSTNGVVDFTSTVTLNVLASSHPSCA